MRTIRKTTKKLAAFLLTGLLATTSLAGCGKDADDKTEQGATVNTPAANSPATVSTANAENTSEDNTSEEPVKVRHLVIGTGGTGPAPFIWTDEKGNLQGYDIAVWDEIMSRLPQYDYEWNVTGDYFAAVDADYLDGVVQHLGINEERKQKYIFSDVYTLLSSGVIVREDFPEDVVHDWSPFAGKKVEAAPSSYYASVFEDWNEAHPDQKLDIIYNENLAQWPDHVADGTTDFYPFTKSYLQYLVESKGLTGVKIIDFQPLDQTPEDIAKGGTAFLFPKDEVELRDAVNEAFEAAIADGTIAKLAEQYLGSAEYAPTLEQVLLARKAHNLQ
ncbi:MAG: transporter substrate-binding domain-containing protein [Eubacterium sp.]|nr:transporter substrate-binding domain-containing protein [Eubacterium sp.]